MIELSLDKVKELAAEIVEEVGPDFKYREPGDGSQCVYVEIHRDRDRQMAWPSCLVGHILVRGGVPLNCFADVNATEIQKAYFDALGSVVELDDDTLYWLDEVQSRQDAGDTWADSVHQADLDLEEHLEMLAEDDGLAL